MAANSKVEKIAAEIQRQHENREPFLNLEGELKPLASSEAYAAQAALHELRKGGPRGAVAGRKIALASRVQQTLCGIDHPIAGAIYQHEIFSSPASISLASYHGLGIEYELALTLNEATQAGRRYTSDELASQLGSAHPAFEMIIDRGADYQNIDALTMIADNAWCAGIVLGDNILPSLQRDGRSINDIPATLQWNNELESAGTESSDPLASLTWMVNLLAEIGCTLDAGQPVITGSVMKTRYPVAGDQVKFTLEGYGSIDLTIN